MAYQASSFGCLVNVEKKNTTKNNETMRLQIVISNLQSFLNTI